MEEAGEISEISRKYAAMDRVFSSHNPRHTYTTHCYENGMRTLTLKKLMGHEFLMRMEIYLYTSMRYEIEEFKKVGPLRSDTAGASLPCGVSFRDEEHRCTSGFM